jgi:hypothetical protein
MTENINELKKALSQAEIERDMYKNVLDSLNIHILITDSTNDEIIFANRKIKHDYDADADVIGSETVWYSSPEYKPVSKPDTYEPGHDAVSLRENFVEKRLSYIISSDVKNDLVYGAFKIHLPCKHEP